MWCWQVNKGDLFNWEVGWGKNSPEALLKASVLFHVALFPSLLLFLSALSSFSSLVPAYLCGGCVPKEAEKEAIKTLKG